MLFKLSCNSPKSNPEVNIDSTFFIDVVCEAKVLVEEVDETHFEMINIHSKSSSQFKHQQPEVKGVDEVQSSSKPAHLDSQVRTKKHGDTAGT